MSWKVELEENKFSFQMLFRSCLSPKSSVWIKKSERLSCGNRCVNQAVEWRPRESPSISQLFSPHPRCSSPSDCLFCPAIHRIFYAALILFYAPVDCFCNDGSAIRRWLMGERLDASAPVCIRLESRWRQIWIWKRGKTSKQRWRWWWRCKKVWWGRYLGRKTKAHWKRLWLGRTEKWKLSDWFGPDWKRKSFDVLRREIDCWPNPKQAIVLTDNLQLLKYVEQIMQSNWDFIQRI